MEDAYVIKKTKMSGWFAVSLVLFIVCVVEYQEIQLCSARAERFKDMNISTDKQIEWYRDQLNTYQIEIRCLKNKIGSN